MTVMILHDCPPLPDLEPISPGVKWHEQWEATDSYNIHPTERLPSGHTLPWRAWRTAIRVRSGRSAQASTPTKKHPWAKSVCAAPRTTNCRHFGETEQRRHGEIGGSSYAVAERRCRHDMMMTTISSCFTPVHALMFVINSVLGLESPGCFPFQYQHCRPTFHYQHLSFQYQQYEFVIRPTSLNIGIRIFYFVIVGIR